MDLQAQSNKIETKQYNPYPKNENGKFQATTDTKYQSGFLPIFANAEARIKELIVNYFWAGKSKNELMQQIMLLVNRTSQRISQTLYDRDAYINGLIRSANKMVEKQYTKMKNEFIAVSGLVILALARADMRKRPKVETPEQLATVIKDNKKILQQNMWAEAKASVRVQNYKKKIDTYVHELAQMDVTTSDGKKPISLWQKAELDVRYNHQMEMINDLLIKGVKYAWISSHPDCSKRCEKWQGKLVALDQPAKMSGFRVGMIDGQWCYSLPDIMAQTDEYGYHNNVINGFNCRHHLIEYKPNTNPPKEYTGQNIKKMRAINSNIKKQEREIRYCKTQEILYNKINPELSNFYKRKANAMTQSYKKYCNRNGFEWDDYRIRVKPEYSIKTKSKN